MKSILYFILVLLLLVFNQTSLISSATVSNRYLIDNHEIKSNQDIFFTENIFKIEIAKTCSYERNFVNFWKRDSIDVAKGAGTAKFGKSAISSVNGFSDNISSLVAKEGLSLEEFKILQAKTAESLTTAQRAAINRIRSSILQPDANTVMQKIIPQSDMSKYISGEYTSCKGYVTTTQDAKHLKTTEDIYYGMRLNYEGTKFTPTDQSCGIIRFKANNASEAIVPKIPKNGGSITDGEPFTGHGFTAGNNGRLSVPEWKMDKWFDMQDGAELWQVTSDGTETLKAIFSKSQNKFIPLN